MTIKTKVKTYVLIIIYLKKRKKKNCYTQFNLYK